MSGGVRSALGLVGLASLVWALAALSGCRGTRRVHDSAYRGELPGSCGSCVDGWCRLGPGTFTMGAPVGELTRAARAEDPIVVTLTNSFEIAQREVTVGDWTRAGLPLSKRQPPECKEGACPVYATWYGAMLYANHLSQQHQLRPCFELSDCREEAVGTICAAARETGPLYECAGYRLPTEAEWEYACRAGTTTAFYNGTFTPSEVPPGRNIALHCYGEPTLDPIGWYCNNSGRRPHAVGEKQPNPACLFDISGNLSEWTTGGYDGRPYGSSPQVDPGGTLGSSLRRVDRGGSYYDPPASADCFARDGMLVDHPLDGTGIRIVRSIAGR